MELREQFTLAPGVSQSMTAFKAKPGSRAEGSPNSSVSGGQTGQRPSISGPITKVILFFRTPLFQFCENCDTLKFPCKLLLKVKTLNES